MFGKLVGGFARETHAAGLDVRGQAGDDRVEAVLDRALDLGAQREGAGAAPRRRGAVRLGRNDPNELEFGVEGARQVDRGGDGGGRLVGPVVAPRRSGGSAPQPRAPVVRAGRRRRRRGRRAAAARRCCPGRDAAEPWPAWGDADDDDPGALGVRESRGRACAGDGLAAILMCRRSAAIPSSRSRMARAACCGVVGAGPCDGRPRRRRGSARRCTGGRWRRRRGRSTALGEATSEGDRVLGARSRRRSPIRIVLIGGSSLDD